MNLTISRRKAFTARILFSIHQVKIMLLLRAIVGEAIGMSCGGTPIHQDCGQMYEGYS